MSWSRSAWRLALGVAVAASLLLGALASPAALADQKDGRLPGLFDKLKAAASPDDTAEIEQQIWAIWLESGDSKLDDLMAAGVLAMQAQDYAPALAAFDKLVKERPDFAEGWNKRATLYYLMGEYQKSLADIDRTLALEPRHFGALSGLGLVNLQLDKLEQAADAWRRVLAISPQDAGARHNLDAVEELIRKKSI